MDFFYNFPLIAALSGIIFAQLVKIPLHYFTTKQFNPGLAFSTGGMPSSHSAAVTALTTAIGIQEGVNSGLFATSFIFGVIVMFDASGVRRHAGEQAIVLNRLVEDFQRFVEEAKIWNKKENFEKRKELKELLGHQPIEVFFGGITGILIALIIFYLK